MYLLFMNLAVGRALAAAYSVAPGVPWYDLHLMTALLLSAWTVAFAILRLRRDALGVIVTICLFATFFFFAVVRFQFTIVSMSLATAAAALAFSFTYQPPRKQQACLMCSTAVFVFIVWSALVRLDSVFLLILLAAPAGIALLVTLRGEASRRRVLLVVFGAACAAAVTIYGFSRIDAALYRASDEWSSHPRFIAARNEVGEYLDVDVNSREFSAALEAVGWTRNDFLLLRAWGFIDRDLYSTERLETFARLMRPVELQPLNLFKRSYWALARHAINLAPYWAFLLLIGLLGARRRTVLFACAMTVWTLLVLTAIELYAKPPPFRVYFPVLALGATLTAIYTVVQLRIVHWWTWTVALLLLPLAGYACTQAYAWHEWREHQRVRLLADMDSFLECRTCVKVLWAGGFPFETWEVPFRAVPSAYHFEYVVIGAGSQTPRVQGFLKARGIHDLLLWMCTERNVDVVVGRQEFLQPIRQYLLEHHGLRVQMIRKPASSMNWYHCTSETR